MYMSEEGERIRHEEILRENDPDRLADKLEEELKQIKEEKEEENDKHRKDGLPDPYPTE